METDDYDPWSHVDIDRYGPGGQELIRRVLGEYDLEPTEVAQLEAAATLTDRRDALEEAIAEQGVITAAYGGRVNPAVAESRQTAVALSRVLAAIKVAD